MIVVHLSTDPTNAPRYFLRAGHIICCSHTSTCFSVTINTQSCTIKDRVLLQVRLINYCVFSTGISYTPCCPNWQRCHLSWVDRRLTGQTSHKQRCESDSNIEPGSLPWERPTDTILLSKYITLAYWLPKYTALSYWRCIIYNYYCNNMSTVYNADLCAPAIALTRSLP